jgi:hypothetical protein
LSNEGLPLEPFIAHDLHRAGSTFLNELSFNRDWVEKWLAHEEGHSSRGVYNKADYEQQRRHMLQEWADTCSEEMGQSDLSRRIAHGDSGYPVLTILNPFLSLRRLPQRRPI